MDLGLAGKKAIVCAASKGLGKGCASSLANNGVDVTICARTPETLEAAAEEIRALGGGAVTTVACDITTDEGRAAVLDACPDPDILVNNAGGPPPGDFRDWNRDDWIKALDANMLTPIALIKALVPAMMERGWGRVVNITSGSVRSPIAQLGLSNSARAGLTGYVAGTSRQVAKNGVVMNNLLPGSHDTDRIRSLTESTRQREGLTWDEAVAKRNAANPTGRIGTAEEFGATCAFMCSQYAGFMIGQNILLDGGAFNSTT